jgi:hypothetical protein
MAAAMVGVIIDNSIAFIELLAGENTIAIRLSYIWLFSMVMY